MDTRSDSSAKNPFPSRAQMTRARLAAEAEASIETARSTTHDAPRSAESAAPRTNWDAVLLGEAPSAPPGKSSSVGGARGLGMPPFAPVRRRTAQVGAEGAASLDAEDTAPLHAERATPQDVQGTTALTSKSAERATPQDPKSFPWRDAQSATPPVSDHAARPISGTTTGFTSESDAPPTNEHTASLDTESSTPHSAEATSPRRKRRKDESTFAKSASAPRRRSTPIEGFTSTSMPIDSGMRVSALSVLLFSALTIAAWALPGAAWSFSPVIVVAGLALALGWNALTGIELPVPTIGVLALSALFVPLMVAYTHNLGSVVPVAGVASSLLIAATVMSLPAPRDRSREERAGDSPQGNPSQGRGRGSTCSATLPASTLEDGNLRTPRRTTSRESSMPNYLVLSHAIAAQALIMSGTAWVALDALNQWAIIIPIAAIIIAAVVWGDQIGSSYRSQSLGALGTGVFAGIIAASAFWGVGMMTSITPIVLPGVTHIFGRLAAVLLLGVVAGLSVALSVIVLDGLLGDHIMCRPPLGALARGAAKFLVAATPIYAIVRIGGI